MTLRTRALVCAVVAGAIVALWSVRGQIGQQWLHFSVYLVAILLSSGMKVAMPKSDGTMSVNFPFILLGILQLSPYQAVALAASSVVALCFIRVEKRFTPVQILFNVANVITATVLAWSSYVELLRLGAEMAPALAVAATVYFVANTIPVVLIIGWESRSQDLLRQWRRDFLWYFPFYLVGAILAAAANYIGIQFGWVTSLLLIPMVYTVYRAYCAQMAYVRDREQHIVEIEDLHLRTIEGLAMAIEAKDKNTHRHLMRVRVYVSEMGRLLRLDEPTMKALLTASVLHDIGKLAVPEHIINKPGKLTPEEFEKMKIHPVVGANMLERVRFPYPVVPIVRGHHEAWDGSGYPDGLKGEEIPIGARILMVVDCFDAVASERPYRRAMPLNEAMALVKSKAGTQFDPAIVALLEKHFHELEEMARERIEEMMPLDTDLFIARGASPGAGFAPVRDPQDHPAGRSIAAGQAGDSQRARPPYESPNPIESAGQLANDLFERSKMPGLAMSFRDACATISRGLGTVLSFDCLAVYLKSGEFMLPHYLDGPGAEAFSLQPIPVGHGLSGWVAHNERPIVNGNPTVEPNFVAASGLFSAGSSAISIPLFDLRGTVSGVVTLYSRNSAEFSEEHLRILLAIQIKFSHALQYVLMHPTTEMNRPMTR